MERIAVQEREDWRETAETHGFSFHSLDGDPYWDESAYYKFTLAEIEEDLEEPAEAIEHMCFEVVGEAIGNEETMRRLAIPEAHWDYVADTWNRAHKNLYGRMDFAYSGNGPAKLLEYNADTPTSLYESSIFQWVWLEQAMERGLVPQGSDQFNSLHEKLIDAWRRIGITDRLHLACAKGSEEDEGTIEYLEDCAKQAGLETRRLFMEDIGISEPGWFTDTDDEAITNLFKLYPWEWILREDFAENVYRSRCVFIEPAWKTVLSNKGLLPLLWEKFPGHPNLLPTYFEDDTEKPDLGETYVRKPIYSREGWNIEITGPDAPAAVSQERPGPYGAEGRILQAYSPLADFSGNRPMCGVWLVASEAAGMCIREDRGPITTDDARFIPHLIMG